MGNEREALRDGLSRKQHIHPADWLALMLEFRPDFAIYTSGIDIKGSKFKRQKKGFQRRGIFSLAALFSTP
jgi:hypothetical protein